MDRKVSGKSHLAAAWAKRANAGIVEASALDEGVLRAPATALVVENIDANAPSAARDAILFALIERGGPILFTAREPPPQWQTAIPDSLRAIVRWCRSHCGRRTTCCSARWHASSSATSNSPCRMRLSTT